MPLARSGHASAHPHARPRGRLTWGHRCAAAGHRETGQGRSRRPRGTRRSVPLWWGTLTERLESLFRELRLNMAGSLLHSGCSVCLSAPRIGGRVTWAGTLGGRRPGCLRLAASSSLWSARLLLLPSLCLSLSRPQVPPSLPASPRPPRLRPAVHWPFPSLPRTLAVPTFSLSCFPADHWGQLSSSTWAAPPPKALPSPVAEVRGRNHFKAACCCGWGRGCGRGGRWREGGQVF